MTTSPGPSAKPPAAGSRSESGKFIEYDRFIDNTLRKTRQQVRNVDIAGSLLLLGAGTLAFFLLVALVDHWVLPGGLGPVLRWSALVLLVAGAAVYCWRTLLPLLLRRINPVYAAHSIERSKPTLKNSLVNFLLLRANPAGLTRNVFEAIEEQAATDLAKVPVDATVDRSKLIKIGYVFLAVLIVSAIYKLASPKDPLRTVGRVVLPWADIDPPTRVRILAVAPGNATVLRGRRVPVTVEVQGLPGSEPVMLIYSTADGQLVERTVAMQIESGGYLFECQLPEGKDGVQQDLSYRIVAGDAASHTFQLQVQAAPTIVIESIDYRYPQYTGLVNQTTEHQSDIKGIEGTQVSIRAVANQPIKTARLDFDCNGSDDQLMTSTDRKATVTFTLALQEDRKTPEHTSYQLTFTNLDGQECTQPIRHQIEVTPDVAPEIEFLAPKKDDVVVPLNAALGLELTAGDPDYSLARVALVGALGGRPIFEQSLLDEERSGQFNSKPRISPKKLGLKAGDELEYWAWAEDNKSPAANRTETPHRRIKVASPGNLAGNEDNLTLNDEKPNPNKRDNAKQNRNPPGQQKDDPQQPDQAERKPGQQDQQDGAGQDNPADGQQDKQQAGAQGQPDKSGAGQQGKGQEGQQDKPDEPGDKGQDDQGGKQGAGKEGAGEQQPEDKPGEQGQGKSDAAQQAGGQQGGDQQGGGQQSGGQQSADKQGGGQQGGGQQAGQGQKPESGGPVAKDGSQDGEAFQKILDRQKQNQPKPIKPQDNSQSGGQAGANDQAKQAQGSQDAGGKPQPAGQGNKPAEPSSEKGPQGKQSEAGQGGNDSGEQAQSGPKGKPSSSKPGGNASGDQNDLPGAPTGEPDDNPGAKPQPSPSQPGDDSSSDQGDPLSGKSDPNAGQSKAKGGAKPPGDDESNSPGEKSGEPQSGGGQGTGKSGQGSRPKGSPEKKPGSKPADGQQPGEAGGGDPQDKQGSSGAGHRDQEKPGSTESQAANAPRNKQPGGEKNSQKRPGEEGSSPSGSNHESNSKGQTAGDQSGGGGEGGGQQGSQPGTGGEGQNSPSDEGGGTANEHGDGETSDRPGQDRQSKGKTGQSGDKPGQGSSSQKSGSKPGQPGGKPDQPGGEPGERPEKSDAKPGGKEPGTPGGDGSGVPQGTGHDKSGDAATPPAADPERADQTNLEFTRKATELALQRLRDQLNRGQVDQKLLDELGWEKEDLDRWVRGYEDMYRKAKSRGEQGKAARQELDATLRSLGIRPRGTQIGSNVRDDQTHGLKEGRRTRPPAEYLEQYKAYTQGTSRVRSQPPAEADKR